MQAYTYQIVIVKEGKKYWAYIPDLPGVYGLGDTPAKAKKDIIQALKLYIEDILAEGGPVPESTAKVVGFDSIEIPVED
ncbi:MAG: type II toxin-antitoxin system HicB family antitoxin [Candidatus Brocadiaceae bacterium]|nr:type II toxin-antitoxin system HicB family antitoxin [Candidatus Brocadiaceae bacterium]